MTRSSEEVEMMDDSSALDLLTDEESGEGGDVDEAAAVGRPGAETARMLPPNGAYEPLQPAPRLDLIPRSYQEDALAAWRENGGRGVVVLPTGAGKTVLALMAITMAPVRPLVVVPTLELLRQWADSFAKHLGLPPEAIGQVGGGVRQWGPATIITYDSAWRKPEKLKPFGLLIFDEVHHLPAASYARIARRTDAPYRLGLTATPERTDLLHQNLERLVGPVVFRRSPGELSRKGHIARFRQERLFIDLSDEEEYEYHQLTSRFRWYMSRNKLWGNQFQQLVFRAGSDPAARDALRCQQQARQVALNAAGKGDQVLTLLRRHVNDRVLIFCEYTSVVNKLSRRFQIPAITYRTPAAERRLTLQRYRAGHYTKLLAGRVLNEGVDVPDANVAIIVSGSATPREQIQRLGRVLRPKDDEAVLYEIIARGTCEERSARARKVKE